MFILDPDSVNEEISGRLESRPLSKLHSYEALSYVWGDKNNLRSIKINGHDFPVTKALEKALRHLRFEDRPRALWIDFICINQKDCLERSEQVSVMGLIYEFAKSVLVWLGETSSDSPVGMRVLRYFATEERPRHGAPWQTLPPDLVRKGLQDIMDRPWFKRLWVVQEIGLSRRVTLQCGHDVFEWKSSNFIVVSRFMRIIKFAEILPEWAQRGLDKVDMQPLLDLLDLQIGNQLDKSWGGSNRMARDLLDVAYDMRRKSCADPRDKVFGVLGMVDHLYNLEDFKPDYTMTVDQVFEALEKISFPLQRDVYSLKSVT